MARPTAKSDAQVTRVGGGIRSPCLGALNGALEKSTAPSAWRVGSRQASPPPLRRGGDAVAQQRVILRHGLGNDGLAAPVVRLVRFPREHPQAGVVRPEQFAKLADDGVLRGGSAREQSLAQGGFQLPTQAALLDQHRVLTASLRGGGGHTRRLGRRRRSFSRTRVTGAEIRFVSRPAPRAPAAPTDARPAASRRV